MPINFKPREFFFGIAIAAAMVFTAVGTRSLIRARTTEPALTCRSNLQQLQAAKDQWALKNRSHRDEVPTWTDLVGSNAYIARKPICPKDGTYTLGPVGEQPRCSIPNHALH